VAGERVQVESKAQGDRELEDLGGKGTVRRADLALTTEWKAPRTEAERRLATIWRDVFCMDKVGSLDDFFELGGDSFTATVLAAEIEATFNMRFAPADIIRLTTVTQQAEAFAKARGAAPMLPDCIILGRAGGPKLPLFVVHAGKGFAFVKPLFFEILAEDRSIYLFQAPGLNARATAIEDISDTTVEDTAKLYVEGMRKVQPKGPYHLASICAGSFIAVEMCRQLEMAGETVGRLILLDPTPAPPINKPAVKPPRQISRMKILRRRIARLVGLVPGEKPDRDLPPDLAPGELTARKSQNQRERLKERVEKMDDLAEDERSYTEERLFRVSQQFRAALYRHLPTPYSGKATLVVCAQRENIVFARNAFWPNHLGSVERKILGKTHKDVFTDGLAETASFVKEALNEAGTTARA